MINLREPAAEVITIARRALVNLPADETFLRGAVALNLGDAYVRQQEVILAADAFAEAVALTEAAGNLTVHLAALGSQGELLASQGHLTPAAAIFQRAIALGQAWGQATGQRHPAAGKAHAFYANVLTAWRQWEEAEQQARAAVECCQRWGHTQHLVDSYLALADSLFAQGKTIEAQDALIAARRVAAESWQRAQEQGFDSKAGRALLDRVDHAQRPPPPATALVEPLSERECDVLRLMADDLTYEAIGETLFISLNTVRTHAKNIYSKLNVNRRSQAIARARAVGLL
ncbi:MAG: DNA-binding response regulator [Caldilinea sp. CFX5]|nr:DNA-binding response regulator [Caldilinea sp. CFX5]